METTATATKTTSTITMRFAFKSREEVGITHTVDPVQEALSDAPGSPQHIASARAARARNRARGIDQFIPGAGDEADIDRWAAMEVVWTVVANPVQCVSSNHPETHVTAQLTQQQESWIRDHLLLDENDSDPGTGDTLWTCDGGDWRDGSGATPYHQVQIDIH